MTEQEKIDFQRHRYEALLHAMQSGVAFTMVREGGPGEGATSPKHLRVGVNSAMVEHSALARLLLTKGLITWLEYYTSLADTMEEEVKSYEAKLSKDGPRVTLG